MILGGQVNAGSEIHPDVQASLDYVGRWNVTLEPRDDAPCAEAQVNYMPEGVDVSPLLSTTLSVGDGSAVWRGERAGHYGLAVRQCARSACSYVCIITVSAQGELLTAQKRKWADDPSEACSMQHNNG